MRTVTIILAFITCMLCHSEVRAQCKSFVKSDCQPKLSPYIHDGNYNAIIMNEGEEAEIYKTIFAGQRYRMMICIDGSLPDAEFVVSDINRNILFDNRKENKTPQWDFKANTSQQIKITIRIPKSGSASKTESELVFGCVGILFGLLDK